MFDDFMMDINVVQPMISNGPGSVVVDTANYAAKAKNKGRPA